MPLRSDSAYPHARLQRHAGEDHLWRGGPIRQVRCFRREERKPKNGSRMWLPTAASGRTFPGRRRSELFFLSASAVLARSQNENALSISTGSASTPLNAL